MKTIKTSLIGRLSLALLGSAWLAGCEPKLSSSAITGTYAREMSFEVRHPETGRAIGHSTLRDTLFIGERGAGFLVRQTRWRRNDFDQQGWRDQRHAENRPAPPYEATFQESDRSLRASSPGEEPLYVEAKAGIVYQGSNRQHAYRKVP